MKQVHSGTERCLPPRRGEGALPHRQTKQTYRTCSNIPADHFVKQKEMGRSYLFQTEQYKCTDLTIKLKVYAWNEMVEATGRAT